MDDPSIPTADEKIKTADLKQKMDELGSAASRTLAENQARLYVAGMLITVAGVWLAYRLGRRQGRKQGRRLASPR